MTSQSVITSTVHSKNVMTSTINSADPKVSTAPKKRRRKAAATGASEDCFTCRKRQTKCDRKRPYCGQCLEFGKDCSGYRTTLTWGVGVASRGKLRGLTCPVARPSVEEKADPKGTEVAQKRKASASMTSKAAKGAIAKSAYAEGLSPASSSGSSTLSDTSVVKSEPDFDSRSSISMPIPVPRASHYVRPYYHHTSSIPQAHGSSFDSDTGLMHLQTSLDYSVESSAYPHSATSLSTSLGTFSDGGYPVGDFPQSPMHIQFADPFQTYLGNSYAVSDGTVADPSVDPLGTFFDSSDHTRNMSFTPTHFSHLDIDNDTQFPGDADGLDDLNIIVADMGPSQSVKALPDHDFTIPRSLFYSNFIHLPSRMQYLLDYYNKHICSVLVAFDSSLNPYRHHVLELATQNEGLQNAIAALAINNMRMRTQEHTGTVSFGDKIRDHDRRLHDETSRPSAEETCYKSVSINQLQMQLTDLQCAQDDSVLATLLILCLFHVCDSGFSKFKTQLEGVQKLLSMRDPSQRTGFIGWVEMFFTWFDVMTSTVNDRETAIRGDRLDMMEYSSNLGALEQFSGCDGRLFKLIARLGRINLLSQNRPVRAQYGEKEPNLSPYGPEPTRAANLSEADRWRDQTVGNPNNYTKMDGNGWDLPTTASLGEDALTDLGTSSTDGRHQFWSEWGDVRSRLQSWSMSPSDVTPGEGMATGQLGPEQRDMMHINESFRASALLYIERLAYPHSPSSSLNFQTLVHDALGHITSISITSCVNKFLLWPLFIAGTECVDAAHRALVRDRCLEIQRESGFYNNISVLEVLERVWAEQGEESTSGKIEEVKRRRKDSAGPQGGFGQAFRWRKAMDRVDGEYIIV